MLETRSLSVAYGRHRAVEDVSVKVSPGEIVVMLGANGAGKSTLLRATPVNPGSTVRMDGREITGLPSHKVVETGIALVPEGRGVFGDLTVQENLLLGAHPKRAQDHAGRNMDLVLGLFPKLTERRRQRVNTMSGGEQQMVAIGRALMSAPSVLMLDEPSLGLSPLLCRELFAALADVRKTGVGVLMVEQNGDPRPASDDLGHITGADTATALAADSAVQRAYLGAG